jgi:hypothetical protein
MALQYPFVYKNRAILSVMCAVDNNQMADLSLKWQKRFVFGKMFAADLFAGTEISGRRILQCVGIY